MKIVLVGRYGEGDILSGPEKVGRELFYHISKSNPNSKFLTYFFKSGKRQKLKKFYSVLKLLLQIQAFAVLEY